jgi:hypothetical protein
MGTLSRLTGRTGQASGCRPLGRRWLRAGVVAAGLVVLGGSLPASAQPLPWSVVPSPNPRTLSNLFGVSCVSADACTAVGDYATGLGGGYRNTLIESWNGTSWSIVPSPSPAPGRTNTLLGVSCVSADVCTAVGWYASHGPSKTLIESWNGTSWSIVPSPNPPKGSRPSLTGVSCVSADACMAVGYYFAIGPYGTLAESWNGTRWSIVPDPNSGGLFGVSCVPADYCMAAGPSMQSWNGTSWSVVPSPNPSRWISHGLASVSCVSADACTGAGSYTTSQGDLDHTLIESWNGTSWSRVPSPNPSKESRPTLTGVSCAMTSACVAVGFRVARSGHDKSLIESWNGTSWSIVPSPAAGAYNELNAVSCAVMAACVAAGFRHFHYRDVIVGETLIETGAATG